MMVSPGFPKGCDAQIGTRIMYKQLFTTPLNIMTIVGMMVNLVRKWCESFEKAPANLKKYSGPKIRNAPVSLNGNNVGLKFQFKMLTM